MAKYIMLRSSGYYFRFQIPVDIQGLVNKSELRYSLRTRSIGIAKSKARLLAGQLQCIIRQLRSGHMKDLTQDQIAGLIQEHIRQALQEDEHERIMDDKPFDPSFHKDHTKILNMAEEQLRDRLMTKEIAYIMPTVDDLLNTEGIKADKDSLAYRMLCREMFKAEGHIMQVKRRRQQGDYRNESSIVSPLPQVSVKDDPTTKTLTEVMDDFFEEGDAEERWRPKTRAEVRASMQVLVNYFGNVPVSSIDRRMMGKYKRDIMKLPPNMNKDKRYRDLDIKAVLKMRPQETIKALTVSKYLSRANTLFEYARMNGEITLNPAEGMRIKKNKRTDERKTIYTPDELARIFGAPGYTGDSFSRSYMYWAPILALFTGARLEEICSLRLQDFEQHEGIWCLNIVADDGKDLKNQQSRRLIPLHPFLIELGVIRRYQHLRQLGEKHFLADLKPSAGRYGGYVSRWYNERFKQSLGFTTKSGHDFHSFRHTFGTNLAHNDINDHSLKALMGHAENTITFSTYVKRGAPKRLYKALVDHLDYGISMHHLKGSKWTIPKPDCI